MSNDESNWAEEVLSQTPGYEAEIFRRYATRLMALARSRLPQDLSSRVDEEDVVQSVFRSFFRRNDDGQFEFENSYDIWQLLAAITYRKVINTVKHHRRDRRDSSRTKRVNVENVDGILEDPNPTPEEVNIMVDYLRWIMSQLRSEQAKIVQLRLEGFSVAEIAESVSLSQRSVKRALAHVRELVKAREASDLDNAENA